MCGGDGFTPGMRGRGVEWKRLKSAVWKVVRMVRRWEKMDELRRWALATCVFRDRTNCFGSQGYEKGVMRSSKGVFWQEAYESGLFTSLRAFFSWFPYSSIPHSGSISWCVYLFDIFAAIMSMQLVVLCLLFWDSMWGKGVETNGG